MDLLKMDAKKIHVQLNKKYSGSSSFPILPISAVQKTNESMYGAIYGFWKVQWKLIIFL